MGFMLAALFAGIYPARVPAIINVIVADKTRDELTLGSVIQ